MNYRENLTSRPPATGLLIGTDDSVEKLKKKRMQEAYRRQLEEQILGSKSAESRQRSGIPRRRAAAIPDERGPSHEEEKQREIFTKRRQQEDLREKLDMQVAERLSSKRNEEFVNRGVARQNRDAFDKYAVDMNYPQPSDSSQSAVYDTRNFPHGLNYRLMPDEAEGRWDSDVQPHIRGYRTDGDHVGGRNKDEFGVMRNVAIQNDVNPGFAQISPGVARQRMLEDVYGRTVPDTSNADQWRPGKLSQIEKEKRRQSMEQQRALLEQQLQESSRMRHESTESRSMLSRRQDTNEVHRNLSNHQS